jgi:hypothetical protein
VVHQTSERKGFGRGDRIRTCDFLRPRHRNVRVRIAPKSHANKELCAERLHSGAAYVARIVAARFLKIQQAKDWSPQAPRISQAGSTGADTFFLGAQAAVF